MPEPMSRKTKTHLLVEAIEDFVIARAALTEAQRHDAERVRFASTNLDHARVMLCGALEAFDKPTLHVLQGGLSIKQ